MPESRIETELLIVFIDLTRFSAESQRVTDVELANVIDEYYAHVGEAVRAAGGRVVKFIGDATLAVFPEEAIDTGVTMLLELKDEVDRMMSGRGWHCRFTAKAHFGTAVAGLFGEGDTKRFDVIGQAVNMAATLRSTGVALSVPTFRKLGPELRTHFKRHTLPVTYIRSEDPRPFR
jgi:adenylate cyclase